MKPHERTRTVTLSLDLERALQEWITASRRAYVPSRHPRDVRDEQAAWLRVQSALAIRARARTAS